MAGSLQHPSSQGPGEPAGEFKHERSGSDVKVFWKDGEMHHSIEERGLSADYPIAYSIGYGNVGHSYLIDVKGHFFQSPAAFYTAKKEWNVSPGYEGEKILDFTRPITSDCLFCHAGAVKTAAGERKLSPISCDRCHGPGDYHRGHPFPGTIINPAKLGGRERDSVCEQCHLEGATVVLNPGKYWWDFHAGERLEEVETHYVFRTNSGAASSIAAVSQAEQLALSACLRGSGGKLWCGTCHDPHGGKGNREQQVREICESCHAPAHLSSRHNAQKDDCVACHMPRRPASDVTHAAVTDHRIAKLPVQENGSPGTRSLVIWHDPKPDFAQRNLGLAYFNAGREDRSVEEFQRAYELLAKIPEPVRDAPVVAALGYMLLGTGNATGAVNLFKQGVRQDPASAEYWLDLGVAENAAGDRGSAITSFNRSVEANPYDYRPYEALARLYTAAHQPQQSGSTLDAYLKLMPESIIVRLLKASEASTTTPQEK